MYCGNPPWPPTADTTHAIHLFPKRPGSDELSMAVDLLGVAPRNSQAPRDQRRPGSVSSVASPLVWTDFTPCLELRFDIYLMLPTLGRGSLTRITTFTTFLQRTIFLSAANSILFFLFPFWIFKIPGPSHLSYLPGALDILKPLTIQRRS
ncbi:hypothetical protein M440DRAFT_224768 [Trichoderma longibrachiatum ATCC 18648]|uniref:Uncharacterized protein n=1 Tax=Trichoderma longibrachiatum ATCC 18648 TaxID=983965 RepID=A0A2T4CBM6_TRILO|nr:hypothetical protein M440DRAFT_224768 [Trichoderma longibrachiatum ATCC 18648]